MPNQVHTGRGMSERIIREFLITYKNKPCLWQTKCTDYSVKERRNEAYDCLLEICRKEHPEAEREFVVKKINSLRGSFRREYRRFIADKTYKTQLWFYDMLTFIADQEAYTDRENFYYTKNDFEDQNLPIEYGHELSFINENDSNRQFSQHEFDGKLDDNGMVELQQIQNADDKTTFEPDNEQYEPTAQCVTEISIDFPHMETTQTEYSYSDNMMNINNNQKDIHNQNYINNIHQNNDNHLDILSSQRNINNNNNNPNKRRSQINSKQTPCDEYTAFGITVAAKLRKMHPTQRLFAENIINQTLFKGLLMQLECPLNSVVVIDGNDTNREINNRAKLIKKELLE